MPANVSYFYQVLIPVIQFDVLDPEWTTQYVFDFDFPKQEELGAQVLDQMQNLGYETHNSILNLGSMWIFAILYFFKVGVYYTLKTIRRFTKYKFGWLEKAGYGLFFHELMSLTFDGYMEWLIAGYLNLKAPITTFGGDIAGNITSFMCLAFCLVMIPGVLIYSWFRPIKGFITRRFQRRFGILTKDIRVDNRFSLSYFIVWVSRRLIFLLIVF